MNKICGSRRKVITAMERLFSNPGLDLITDKILEHLQCQDLAHLELSSTALASYFLRRHVWKRRWDEFRQEKQLTRWRSKQDCTECEEDSEDSDCLEGRYYRRLCHHYLCDLPVRWREGAPQAKHFEMGGGVATAAVVGLNSIALIGNDPLEIVGPEDDFGDALVTRTLSVPSVFGKKAYVMTAHGNVVLVGESYGDLSWWHYGINNLYSSTKLWGTKVYRFDKSGESYVSLALSRNVALSMNSRKVIKVWRMQWQGEKDLRQGAVQNTATRTITIMACNIRHLYDES